MYIFLNEENEILNEFDEFEDELDSFFEDNDGVDNDRIAIFEHSFDSYQDSFEPYCKNFNRDEEEESVREFLDLNSKQFMYAKVNKTIRKEELERMLKMIEKINDSLDSYHFYFDKDFFCIRVIIRQENKSESYNMLKEDINDFQLHSAMDFKMSSSRLRQNLNNFRRTFDDGQALDTNKFSGLRGQSPQNFLFGLGKEKKYEINDIYTRNLDDYLKYANDYYKKENFELMPIDLVMKIEKDNNGFLSSMAYRVCQILELKNISNLCYRLYTLKGYGDIAFLFIMDDSNKKYFYGMSTFGYNKKTLKISYNVTSAKLLCE